MANKYKIYIVHNLFFKMKEGGREGGGGTVHERKGNRIGRCERKSNPNAEFAILKQFFFKRHCIGVLKYTRPGQTAQMNTILIPLGRIKPYCN